MLGLLRYTSQIIPKTGSHKGRGIYLITWAEAKWQFKASVPPRAGGMGSGQVTLCLLGQGRRGCNPKRQTRSVGHQNVVAAAKAVSPKRQEKRVMRVCVAQSGAHKRPAERCDKSTLAGAGAKAGSMTVVCGV